jgi:hypothetical protein
MPEKGVWLAFMSSQPGGHAICKILRGGGCAVRARLLGVQLAEQSRQAMPGASSGLLAGYCTASRFCPATWRALQVSNVPCKPCF